jgi:hypothetical protein
MAYRCLECGHIFDEGEQAKWEEYGEFWGVPYSQTESGCPLCKGDYEETKQCKICGSEHLKDELDGGVCEECIEKYRYDVDMCFNIGSKDTIEIELNGFLASMFDKQEIEEILLKELKEAQKCTPIDCNEFVEADRDWFAEKLVEEVRKNENGEK